MMNGIELRSLRKENGIVLRKFAKMIHTRAATISDWENGVADIPSEKESIIRSAVNAYVESKSEEFKRKNVIRHNEPVVNVVEESSELSDATISNDTRPQSGLSTEDWLRIEDLITRVVSKTIPIWMTTYKGPWNIPSVSSNAHSKPTIKPYDPLDSYRTPTPEEDIDAYSRSLNLKQRINNG